MTAAERRAQIAQAKLVAEITREAVFAERERIALFLERQIGFSPATPGSMGVLALVRRLQSAGRYFAGMIRRGVHVQHPCTCADHRAEGAGACTAKEGA